MISLEQIIRELGDTATLMVFRQASVGLRASTRANEELGLTTKQYYSRIESLHRLGLIEKVEGQYVQTATGATVGKQLNVLQDALANPECLSAINLIQKSGAFTAEEKSALMHSLSTKGADPSPAGPVVYQEFGKLVVGVTYWIERARGEVFLASRYHDPALTPAAVSAVSRGVKFNYLDGNPKGTDFQSRLQAVVRTPPDRQTLMVVKKLLASPDLRVTLANVNFSFLVIDAELCIVEIVDPLAPQNFSFALSFFNKEFAARLIQYFERVRAANSPRAQAMPVLVQARRPSGI